MKWRKRRLGCCLQPCADPSGRDTLKRIPAWMTAISPTHTIILKVSVVIVLDGILLKHTFQARFEYPSDPVEG